MNGYDNGALNSNSSSLPTDTAGMPQMGLA